MTSRWVRFPHSRATLMSGDVSLRLAKSGCVGPWFGPGLPDLPAEYAPPLITDSLVAERHRNGQFWRDAWCTVARVRRASPVAMPGCGDRCRRGTGSGAGVAACAASWSRGGRRVPAAGVPGLFAGREVAVLEVDAGAAVGDEPDLDGAGAGRQVVGVAVAPAAEQPARGRDPGSGRGPALR